MIAAIGIAQSGLDAQRVRLEAAAHNLANLQTDGYRPRRVELAENASGGVRPAGVSEGPPGPSVPDPAVPDGARTLSGTDPAVEMVELMTARLGFSANARALGVTLDMVGRLLDEWA